MRRPTRREVLSALPAAGLALRAGRVAAATPFGETTVPDLARSLAAAPYQPASLDLPPALAALDYDAYRGVRFRPEQAVWRGVGDYQLQMFHRGALYRRRVDLHEVSGGVAEPILYSRDLFRFDSGDPGALPPDLGFAGFRIHTPMNVPGRFDELAVFLGASYFRAVARGGIYGLSARGLSIGSGEPEEEFPDFTAFWIERPAPGASAIVVHALLDSPSVAGAYRFVITPGAPTRMAITARLFPRAPLARAGLAPLTSMYLFGPEQPRRFDDFRPEVHDSDGLMIDNGAGERLWRPLINPPQVQESAFVDGGPRGFGLLQRQRSFPIYQDLEAQYDRRPSAWVQPRAGFDAGDVRLAELTAKTEGEDNIVAAWRPAPVLAQGREHLFAYDLLWGQSPEPARALARIAQWRTGLSASGARLFIVEFTDGVAGAPAGAAANITATRGQIRNTVTQADDLRGVLRVSFEFEPDGVGDLRLGLRRDGQPASEVWTYRWTG